MPRVILIVGLVVLALYALIECAMTDSEKMPAKLPKPMWIMIILLTATIALGPLAWIVLLRIERHKEGEKSPTPLDLAREIGIQKPAVEESHQPLGPDDDPEYLARIERELMRQKLQEQRDQQKAAERRQRASEQSKTEDSDADAQGPESQDSNTPNPQAEPESDRPADSETDSQSNADTDSDN
ncbi:hypothetical protein BSR28_05765 [Boudabousia liubingyangii]|uniref:hypothetical protein n=1 Tax=Boudabousia liubingyangii TaxID=1921764 RepID=UPI00093CFDF2|nr:hypothetical protein [Boudabousia liubingyangii]OKL46929.1 hypothetical protein BSR28_05765 [Boudabousia liubingyangii]